MSYPNARWSRIDIMDIIKLPPLRETLNMTLQATPRNNATCTMGDE
jgi:hypothetical protein